MIEVQRLFEKYPEGVFATKSGESIKLRIFRFLFSEDCRFYFSTTIYTSGYKHMKKDCNVAFCSYSPDYSEIISISGKAVFVEDAALKKRACYNNPVLRHMFHPEVNPHFEIFYIDVSEAEYVKNGVSKKVEQINFKSVLV